MRTTGSNTDLAGVRGLTIPSRTVGITKAPPRLLVFRPLKKKV